MDIWQEKVTLRFSSVDSTERLTPAAAFDFFQEAAISHAAVLGVGRDSMTQSGQAWILSRLSVFIEKRPRYSEILKVRSWPRGPEKLFCLRDYDISDESGKTLVRGRSGWLVLDTEKRRPLRIQGIVEKLPLNEGLNALLSGPRNLEAQENLVVKGTRQAAYSDIDSYYHVNNVRYVQWIQDITPPDLLEKAAQIRLDINYMSETLPGELLELLSAPIDGCPQDHPEDYPVSPLATFAYEGRRQGSPPGQCTFRAELRLGL
jgi:acyl-ACP thioesterase